MKERDYQIPTIYPVNLDKSRPNVSFGLPDTVLGQSVYANSDYELMRFLNFGAISRLKDAETDQPYRLLAKNIDGDNLKNVFEAAQIVLDETCSAVRNVIGESTSLPLGKGNYWRYLVDLPKAEDYGLEGVKLKLTPDSGPGCGPHASLNQREERVVLRVKASTLEQLHQLFEQARSILV